jgi:cob(I)alamin adenosyltransferase
VLVGVQTELFEGAADVAVPLDADDERLRVAQSQVEALEADCDRFNEALPELKSFVLPGGEEAAARIHVARAVCRRAERVALEAPVNPLALVYLNRLSDLLFILARAANAAAGRDEPLWKPGASR